MIAGRYVAKQPTDTLAHTEQQVAMLEATATTAVQAIASSMELLQSVVNNAKQESLAIDEYIEKLKSRQRQIQKIGARNNKIYENFRELLCMNQEDVEKEEDV